MKVRGALFRPLLIIVAIALSLASAGLAQTMSVDPEPVATAGPTARKIISDVPTDLVPSYETLWKCACDSDGCWPGCFTLASASVLKYWSQKTYPNLWPYRGAEDENNGLIRLRELFPNLLCFGNGNGNGQPGDSGYDAYDVATGLRQWAVEHGYRFNITPVPSPSFEQIVAEIDAGRPVIGAFGQSPWGSHAGTIVGYDTSKKRQVMIVRPNLPDKPDTELEWGIGYQEFGIVTVAPGGTAGPDLAPAQITFDVVVGANDPGFSAAGEWRDAGGLGHAGAARFAPIVDGGPTSDETAFARWTPSIPFDGAWEIMAWMPLEKLDPTSSGSVLYKVTHAEGQSLVRRSQRDTPQGWLSLGTYPMVRGERGSVSLANTSVETGTHRVWADAVRFVWRAPLLLRGEDDAVNTYLVRDGRRRALPQDGGLTFAALRLLPSNIRKLTPLQLAQYPSGEPLPSVLSAWVGAYFNNTQLAPPSAAIRNDTPLALRWEGLSPVAGVSAIGFSGRWTRVMAFSQGAYTFKIQAAGGLRLWVDGRLEIDAWDAQGAFIEHQAKVALDGGLHRLEVEYVNRTGGAALVFVDLPPNPPLPVDLPVVRYTRGLTATLSWLDTGDADGSANGAPRKFTVSVGREDAGGSPREILNSDWLTTTSWLANFPGSGAYVWRVASGDGATVSEWSAPRRIVVDRAPPWAQMASATNPGEEQDPATKAPSAIPRAPGLRLRWAQTDTLSGVAFVDIQAREIVRATTAYTFATEYREQPRSAVEVVVEGGREITRATLITALVPYTGVVEVRSFVPNPAAPWKLVLSNLTGSETFFVGTPGSVYEFRARAVDWAGNAQDWYDGYSVIAQMDPNAVLAPVSTPSPTATATRVPPTAVSAALTPTPTRTPTSTGAPTQTPTPTSTPTPTATANLTQSPPASPSTTATPTPTVQPTPSVDLTPRPTPAATKPKSESPGVASKRIDPEPTPTGVLSALATSPFARATFSNSAYLRVDVLAAAYAEAPLPNPASCSSDPEGDRGARAILTLRVSNNSPIEIRGWRMAVMAGDLPAQICLLGAVADGRLPAIAPGARRDIVVVAYAPFDTAFTRVEAQWQGERYAVCADNEPVTKTCAPQVVSIPKNTAWAPTPLPDFSKTDAEESLQGPEILSVTPTPTATAVPVPTPTPTRAPAFWTVTAQSLDASAWGRPIQASCFAYDDGDPVTRWQTSLRIENASSSEMRDLRVTFFEGSKALRTCFHGYGGLIPSIPPADGRNISFFAFVEKGQSMTSVLIEAMGQSRRLCVSGGTLVACK